MLEIFIFAFGIMYSPGPVNLLSLFAGISGQGWKAFPFCIGVGCAMWLMFTCLGYLGSTFIPPSVQKVIAVLGGIYIGYLGIKVMRASFSHSVNSTKTTNMNFVTGLLMQLGNPKALVVILPIVTVQFPKANIEGLSIAVMSLALGALACGAPSVYLTAGNQLKQAVLNPIVMKWVNRIMAILLCYISYQFIAFANEF